MYLFSWLDEPVGETHNIMYNAICSVIQGYEKIFVIYKNFNF